jgi:triacylglycerol lipase
MNSRRASPIQNPIPRTSGQESEIQNPVVLVPGIHDDDRKLTRIRNALHAAGRQAVVIISPQPSDGSVPLDALAVQLAARIAASFEPAQPLDFFGFSMGGLIIRSYLQQLGGLDRAQRLVTLATPHQGSRWAHASRCPACTQMQPGSAFLVELNRRLDMLHQVDFTSIWTPFDLIIVPQRSSVLPVGRMVRVLSPMHGLLPYDPRVVQTVVNYLGVESARRAPKLEATAQAG